MEPGILVHLTFTEKDLVMLLKAAITCLLLSRPALSNLAADGYLNLKIKIN